MSLVKYTAGAADDTVANARTNNAVKISVKCFMICASCNIWNEAKINVEAKFTSSEKLRVKRNSLRPKL